MTHDRLAIAVLIVLLAVLLGWFIHPLFLAILLLLLLFVL